MLAPRDETRDGTAPRGLAEGEYAQRRERAPQLAGLEREARVHALARQEGLEEEQAAGRERRRYGLEQGTLEIEEVDDHLVAAVRERDALRRQVDAPGVHA